ncbi:MAG: glycosyltransferase family 4 protein [Thermodesulfobacterium sp.]|nr:glycosyltransferase family 4 protein [Thermodesulfobacterium sp.]
MLKIIYPVPEKVPSNYARFIQIFNTCNSLANLGLKVEICCSFKKGNKKEDLEKFYGINFSPNLSIKSYPVIQVENLFNLKFSSSLIYKIKFVGDLLKEYKNNHAKKLIIYLRYPKLTSLFIFLKRWIDIFIIYEAHEIFSFKNKKLFEIERKLFEISDLIICITNELKNKIIANFETDFQKIHVIPDAVRDDWLNIKPEKEEYIFYAGSLKKWKGVDVLIKAMKYLPGEKLLIAGNGEESNYLQNIVKEENLQDRIKFLGYIPHTEIPKFLSKAKILVLPNVKEDTSVFTSPLKLFEYMAIGKPIVASDIPSLKEILKHEENAYLVKPGDPKALAEGIRKVLSDGKLRNKISLGAKKKVTNYTYSARAQKIKQLIEILIMR